jgi:hypothetical protein
MIQNPKTKNEKKCKKMEYFHLKAADLNKLIKGSKSY